MATVRGRLGLKLGRSRDRGDPVFAFPNARRKNQTQTQASPGSNAGASSEPRRSCFCGSGYQAQKPNSNPKRRLGPKLAQARGRGDSVFALPDTTRKNWIRMPSGARARDWLELGAAASLFLLFRMPGAKTGSEYLAAPGPEAGSNSGPRQPCFRDSRYQAQKLNLSARRRLGPKLARARGRGNPVFAIPDTRRKN